MVKKSGHYLARVPRLPNLDVTGPQERPARLAPGCGAVREQHAQPRVLRSE